MPVGAPRVGAQRGRRRETVVVASLEHERGQARELEVDRVRRQRVVLTVGEAGHGEGVVARLEGAVSDGVGGRRPAAVVGGQVIDAAVAAVQDIVGRVVDRAGAHVLREAQREVVVDTGGRKGVGRHAAIEAHPVDVLIAGGNGDGQRVQPLIEIPARPCHREGAAAVVGALVVQHVTVERLDGAVFVVNGAILSDIEQVVARQVERPVELVRGPRLSRRVGSDGDPVRRRPIARPAPLPKSGPPLATT